MLILRRLAELLTQPNSFMLHVIQPVVEKGEKESCNVMASAFLLILKNCLCQ